MKIAADYQAQDDLHTLTRAEEIKADSKRHDKALAHGKSKAAAIQAVVEGSPAEEAMDAKQALPKRGQRAATHKAMGAAKRTPKVNKASVI